MPGVNIACGLVVVWWAFMAHVGPRVEQCLHATGYLNIIANQVHPFVAEVCPSENWIFSAGSCPMPQG
jgi:hypothetical protein